MTQEEDLWSATWGGDHRGEGVAMGEGGVDLEHDDEELQEVDVHLHRFLTDELLPAVVNQIRKAAGQLLV